MPPRCSSIPGTLTPFLYPFLINKGSTAAVTRPLIKCLQQQRNESTAPAHDTSSQTYEPGSHLNPSPTDYARTIFSDRATIKIHSGAGGHGCISFLREKYISAGPANGGDGGSGGNVWIQAVRGETSLHKLSRHSNVKAGRGANGMGSTRGGERGDDVVIKVPVGTVVREVERIDPVAIEKHRLMVEQQGEMLANATATANANANANANADPDAAEQKPVGDQEKRPWKWDREKWLLYPATSPRDIATAEFPRLPKPRPSPLSMMQAKAPISLDLSMPMDRPILLAAGASGGMGNPHFVTKTVPRPKFATKGEPGLTITLELELKLLADVGLVGLPNAGKSTLLRAMSNSRTRVGNWAFTTLQPNIGTVVLDNHRGRPLASSSYASGEPRTNFTIADIPGLVTDAHLDRGLGISFLRHVERARVLAFVVDLSAGDAVTALQGLWREVALYEAMRIEEEKAKGEEPIIQWSPFLSIDDALANRSETIVFPNNKAAQPSFEAPMTPQRPSIADKPWFVVATKADLEGTQENFEALRGYLEGVNKGIEEHPSCHEGQQQQQQEKRRVWEGQVQAVPVSAINGHGTEAITELVVGFLDD